MAGTPIPDLVEKVGIDVKFASITDELRDQLTFLASESPVARDFQADYRVMDVTTIRVSGDKHHVEFTLQPPVPANMFEVVNARLGEMLINANCMAIHTGRTLTPPAQTKITY